MKKSIFLKFICYITLPIFIALLLWSIFILSMKEYNYYDKQTYFSSHDFVSNYIAYLNDQIYELIYNNKFYNSIQDENIEIHYDYNENHLSTDVTNRYYLIIYKNKALTNVELSNTTNTIKGIKTYIDNNDNSKKANIIYGKVESESDAIQKFAIKYLDIFEKTYYTVNYNEEQYSEYVEYIKTKPEDYEIYTSYVEQFGEDTRQAVISNIIEKVNIYEDDAYILIPFTSVFIILILVYLIIAIGHRKGTDGIALNDFDKIPLEIILVIAIVLGSIPLIIIDEIYRDYSAIISLTITAFCLIYILSVITLNTLVKRFKSKTVLKTSIIGKILILISKCLVWLYNKYKSIFNTLTYSNRIGMKVFIYFGIVIPLGVFIVFAFRETAIVLVLEILLATIVGYKTLKTEKGFVQVENKLKEMYEGNNQTTLKEADFDKEFHNSVKYLNDISNGFENAIQDRIKSERLKAELITNVSHDIKTPLTSIINYVDLLKHENIQNDRANEYIGILDNKAQRLKKLTEDLVEASKVSTGNISLNLEKINIVELIKQALGEFEDKFKKRGLDLIIDNTESVMNIKADSRYMYRIIENLFSNISKYALENSRVYIDIRKKQDKVIIEIKNISKERLNISAEELIQRFVRGDKSRNTEGSGLGISIAQNLTELQGGEFILKLDGDLFKVELSFGTGSFL